jgi:hypothetical protein
MEALEFMFGLFMFLGIIGIIVSPAAPLAMNMKLSPNQYSTQIFLPSTFSLLLVLGAYVGFSYLDYDETKLQYMIIFSALGGILISLLSISLSWNRIRYAAF